MPRLRIADHPRILTPRPGESALDAARAAGIAFPHGCRSGRCGACRARVVAGHARMGPHSPWALSQAERALGLVLACRAYVDGEAHLVPDRPDDPLPRPRRLVLSVHGVERLTPRVVRLRLHRPAAGFAFLPGQYATLGLPGRAPRDFSFAGPAGDETLAFDLRDAGPGSASARAAGLRPGDPVTLEGPFGRAHLRAAHAGPLLLLAGGTGLAPMGAIAEAALARRPERPVALWHGARDEDEVYDEARFAALTRRHPAFRFAVVLSDPGGPTRRATGTVVAAALADLDRAAPGGQPLDAVAVHAAGPPPMVAAARAALAARGLAPDAFHADAFTPVTPAIGPAGA